MAWLAAAVGVALGAVTLANTFPIATAAYVLAGVLNAYFFAATLAVRTEYSPARALGQVFMWIGALKIAASSAGTALAGALIATVTYLPLYLGAALTTLVVMVSIVDRHRSRREPE